MCTAGITTKELPLFTMQDVTPDSLSVECNSVIREIRAKKSQKITIYPITNRLTVNSRLDPNLLVGAKLTQICQTKEIIEGFYVLSFNSHVADVPSDISKKK